MKRKGETHFKLPMLIMLCVMFAVSVVGFVACKDPIVWKLADGTDFPASLTVEYGTLYSIPEVKVSDSKQEYEVAAAVRDSEGGDVRLSNNKFRATDMAGYVIVYTATVKEGTETKEINVTVRDSEPPRISTISADSDMSMVIGKEFMIPPYKISEASDSTLKATITVKDPAGNAVAVTDDVFTPNTLGTYTITYSATDKNNNTSTEVIPVQCVKGKVLNKFDVSSDSEGVTSLSRAAWTRELVTENVISKDGGIRVSHNKDDSTWSFVRVKMSDNGAPITMKELLQFEKIQMYVYASFDVQFMIGNQIGSTTLRVGMNIVTFDRQTIEDAFASIANPSQQYNESNGQFYLQERNSPADQYLIFDQLIGVYSDDFVPAQAKIKIASTDGFVAKKDAEYTVPTATATKLSDESALNVKAAVKAPDGTPVTVSGGKFTPTVYGDYTITYTIDGEGYDNDKEELIVTCANIVELNSFANAEGKSITSMGRANWTKEFTTENALSADGATALHTNGDSSNWSFLYVTISLGGEPIAWKDLFRMEKVQLYVHSTYATVLSLSVAATETDRAIKAGVNCVEFTQADLRKAYEHSQTATNKQLNNGQFFIGLRKTVKDSNDVITFDNFYGVYRDDYVPPVYTVTKQGVNGMTVIKGEEFTIPACVAKDGQNNDIPMTITVTDRAGSVTDVTAAGKFTPTEFGEYLITYTLTGAGYEGETETLTVNCENAALLNDFNATTDIPWNNMNGTLSVVTENTFGGNGVKLQVSSAASWKDLTVRFKLGGSPITRAQLDKFVYLKLNVYASAATTIHLAGQFGQITLEKGMNCVKFTKSAFTLACNGSELQFAEGDFLIELKALAADEYLVFDSIMGVYPEDYEPDDSTIQINVKGADGMILPYGKTVSVPAYTAVNEGVFATAEITVAAPDGTAVTPVDGEFKVEQLGDYTITYAVGTEIVTVVAKAKKAELLSSLDKIEDMPEKGRANWTRADSSEFGVSDKGLALFTNGDATTWAYFKLALTIKGRVLTYAELAEFDAVQFYLYSTYATQLYLADEGGSGMFEVVQGENIVTFTKSQIQAAYESNAKQFTDGAFFVGLKATRGGVYDELFLDEFYGIRPDSYEPPVNYVAHFSVMDGAEYTGILNQSFTFPAISVTGNEGETLDYEITVFDAADGEVSFTGNSFIPTEENIYTITYTVTTVNYAGQSVSIALNVVNGKILNNFTDVSTIACQRASWTKEVVNGGIKVVNADGNGYQKIFITVNKDGAATTWEEMQKFEKIIVKVYASYASPGFYFTNVASKAVVIGENTLTFTLEELLAGTGVFDDTKSAFGFITTNGKQDGYWIFREIIGIYPEDYVEPEEPEEPTAVTETLNPFTDVSTVTPGRAAWTKEAVAEGIKVTNTEGNAYQAVNLGVKKDGAPLTWAELIKFEKLVLRITSSHDCTVYISGLGNKTLVAGQNTVEYTAEVIAAAGEDEVLTKGAGTLVFGNVTGIKDGYWIFEELSGVYPEDYVEPESNEVMLNACTDAASITTQRTDWGKEKVDKGIKITNGNAGNYQGIYISLKINGEALTWEKLQEFESIKIKVYSTYADNFYVNGGLNKKQALTAGAETVLVFSVADMVAFNDAQLAASKAPVLSDNGVLTLSNTAKPADNAQYFIFQEVIGVYPQA